MSEQCSIVKIHILEQWDQLVSDFPIIEDDFLFQKESLIASFSQFSELTEYSALLTFKDFKILVLAIQHGDKIGFLYRPLLVFLNKRSQTIPEELLRELKTYLGQIQRQAGLNSLSCTLPEELVSQFEKEKIAFSINQMATVDLTLSDAEIKSNLRKSYRSLINWGKKNLLLSWLDSTNITLERFKTFSDYYDEISGHPKSQNYWSKIFHVIQSGKGFVLFSRHDDKLIAATLVLYGKKRAYYALGAYDKNLIADNVPVSHWPIYASIFKAKELNLVEFELGVLNSEANPKEQNIFIFKRGFATNTVENQILKLNFL